jgi:hypothetical protein
MRTETRGAATCELAWAAAGAGLTGACLGARLGAEAALALGLTLPAALVGVAGLTAPALYIGAAFAGVAPAPRALLGHLHRGLGDAGRVMAGLAPVLVLLTATAASTATVRLLGLLVVFAAVVLGLRVTWPRLFGDAPAAGRAAAVFTAWSLVALGIGFHVLDGALAAQAAR